MVPEYTETSRNDTGMTPDFWLFQSAFVVSRDPLTALHFEFQGTVSTEFSVIPCSAT